MAVLNLAISSLLIGPGLLYSNGVLSATTSDGAISGVLSSRLIETGATLGTQITLTGQQVLAVAQNNATNLSGNLVSTSGVLASQISTATGKGVFTVNELSGTINIGGAGGGVDISLSGQTIWVSGEAGGGGNWGVVSTNTASGLTTLTSNSSTIQIFTGTSIQTVQLPLANALEAGTSVMYVFKNKSTSTITLRPSGSDSLEGGTGYILSTNDAIMLVSDSVSSWSVI